MKLSAEQKRVLQAMRDGKEYTPKSLRARWTTLANLYERGLVGEEILWRWWALLTGRHDKRRFKIAEDGIRYAMREGV